MYSVISWACVLCKLDALLLYQWLSTHRVDHFFCFWRRLIRYEQALHAAKHSQINLWAQIVPFTGPPLQVRHSAYSTQNGLSLPHLGARAATSGPVIRCRPNWADLGSSAPAGPEPSTSWAPSTSDVMQPEVHLMLHGEGYEPKPLRSWRKCPLIQASRKAEFRPLEIRPQPENLRTSLNGCKVFQPQQIAEYNRLLQRDKKLVSGVDKIAARARTKPGRLYHKFDSLCALATSKAARLLLIQHRELNHVFYAICYDPAHKLYNELLNMYERRWFAVSKSYGKEDGV